MLVGLLCWREGKDGDDKERGLPSLPAYPRQVDHGYVMWNHRTLDEFHSRYRLRFEIFFNLTNDLACLLYEFLKRVCAVRTTLSHCLTVSTVSLAL